MADHVERRPLFQCSCGHCRANSKNSIARDHRSINRVMATLNERQRRLFAGILALHRGHGGVVAVSQITGLSRTTVRRGITELRLGIGLSANRQRREGGGRKLLEKKIPPW
jgi:hypothetical protein